MNQELARSAGAGILSFLASLSAPMLVTASEQREVTGELSRLAAAHGFAVAGLERTENAVGRAAEGENLFPRLRALLENFDHVIVQDPKGGVERVIVLGEKAPFEPLPPGSTARSAQKEAGEIVMESERRGSQHLVRVSLGGRSGSRVERDLQLDTGADYLVLPLSLASELGVDQGRLAEREMQTANGKITARVGKLPSIWLGESRLRDIETAFLEDEKLNGGGLLGMSVLKRYKLTIDDDNNRITLGGKQGNDRGEAADPRQVEQDVGGE